MHKSQPGANLICLFLCDLVCPIHILLTFVPYSPLAHCYCYTARRASTVASALRQQHAELVGSMLSDGCTDVEVDQHLQTVNGNIPGLRFEKPSFTRLARLVRQRVDFIPWLGQYKGGHGRSCTRTPYKCVTLCFATVACPVYTGALGLLLEIVKMFCGPRSCCVS